MAYDLKISKKLLVLLIILLGLAAYSNSFRSPFQFDDGVYIVNNEIIRNVSIPEGIVKIYKYIPSRFITFLSYAVNYRFGGYNVFGYHLVNFLIHITNAFLVWWFISLLFKTPKMENEKIKNLALPIAYFSSLLFLVHPIQTQAVIYLTQRAASLAAFFYLLSLCFFIKGRMSGKVQSSSVFFFGAVLSGLLGMFTKENVFTLPFIILLIEFCFISDISELKKYLKSRYFILFAVILISSLFLIPALFKFKFSHIFLRKVVSGSHESDILTTPVYFITQFRVMIKYIQLLFFPVNQTLDYDFPASYSIFELDTFISFIALLVILLLGIAIYKKHKLISFGILWFFITNSVESSIIPIHHVIFEHRQYLPSVGFFLTCTTFLFGYFKSKRKIVIILSVIILTLSFMTFNRNKVWSSPLAMWKDVVKKAPVKARGYYNLAKEYSAIGDYYHAVINYNMTLALNDNYERAYNNRGLINRKFGKMDLALEDFTKAITLQPKNYRTYNNRGATYSMMDMTGPALKDLNKAIELKPDFIEAYNNRGIVYSKMGEYDKAISDFNKVIKGNPSYIYAYLNKATAYERMGDYKNALKETEFLISVAPNNPSGYVKRSKIYDLIGDTEKSQKDMITAKKLGYIEPQENPPDM